MAMLPLGHMAGLGAAIIGAISSLISVPVAVLVDSFLTTDVMPIAIGFVVFCVLAMLSVLWADGATKHETIHGK